LLHKLHKRTTQIMIQRHIFYCGLFIFLFNAGQSRAQHFPAKNYPRDYFQWPVKAKIGIAANFGELRPNHYHMGLDCRTDQKQNVPVIAAAAGYIAKVKIEPYGFGRAIYINHPNGLTTLYAHLNDFDSALEAYVKQQQYKLESWKVFLDIPPNLFPVQQGQQVAWSGNTGGSQGPHLHFEIRETKTDKVLNPLLFNFPIPDTIAPDLYRLAVYNRQLSTYEQSPKFIALKKTKGGYAIPLSLLKTTNSDISFGISAYDRSSGSGNRNGIYSSMLYVDGQPVSGFQIDNISYDETRYLNAHIDYKLRSGGGAFVQHLTRPTGYNNSIYTSFKDDGVLRLRDTLLHRVKIEIGDANDNISVIEFDVKMDKLPVPFAGPDPYKQPNEFHPGFLNIYESGNLSLYLPEDCLYDSIRFKATPAGSDTYLVQNGSTPFNGYFPIKIKPAVPVDDSLKNKMVMQRTWGGKADFKTTNYIDGWYKSAFREFGYFKIFKDVTPPSISSPVLKEGMNVAKLAAIRFGVSDNSEEFDFRAELDGKFLRFSNDKGRTFIYRFDEMCAPGPHELKIIVTDQVGNRAEKIYHFTR